MMYKFLDFTQKHDMIYNMKSKIILSGIGVVLVWATNYLVNLYYSPLTGALTANALNGDNTDFALAKFVQNGGAFYIIAIVFGLILMSIWWEVIVGKDKK